MSHGHSVDPASIPLIVLTGFLGAGKTTVLNRVLLAQHHRRVAVLVNELGRIDVDAGLIRARAGDVLELTGGCVCHQIGVQRELWSALDDVIARSRPDVVVLETTGIAEPAAILSGLARERGSHESPNFIPIRAAAVITVVDAEAGARQLERHHEARDQVIAADRILISKIDVAPTEHLVELHRRLHDLNPDAERAAFPRDGAATAALVPWLLDARPIIKRSRRSRPGPITGSVAHSHAHAHQIAAATYVDDVPLIGDALLLACERLGDRLVRAKGYVHLAGEPRRGFLERAGGRTRLGLGEPWGDDTPFTRLVLIGEDLDEAALHRQLWACRIGAGGSLDQNRHDQSP
jgi:G3E family GTPase